MTGAKRCLRCGGELGARSRRVSPFGGRSPLAGSFAGGPLRRRAWLGAGIVLAMLGPVAVTAAIGGSSPALLVDSPAARGRLPRPEVTLAPSYAPPGAARLPVAISESCVGRLLPTDRRPLGRVPPAISGRLATPWRCDGDGARLPRPQSAEISFPGPRTVSAMSVFGYDLAAPCRFVTGVEVVLGSRAYELRLPARRYHLALWFHFPPTRVTELSLVVTATVADGPANATGCSRTSIAGLSFTGPAAYSRRT